MSLTLTSSFDEVAEAIILECVRRGYKRYETVAVTSTGIQESTLRMVWSSNGLWYCYFQQDGGYPNRMDPNGCIRGFLDRLDVKRSSAGASHDIWLNIFWLQQAPSRPSADEAYRLGRQAYLTEIQRHIVQATQLYDRFAGGQMGWTGDPVWLADVLRAEGLKVIEHDGWRSRGHGDFKDIRGVLCHHTAGGGPNDWQIVQNGRPDLPGPLAQLVLERDGTYRVIAAGVCWHAGRGSWPGWPTNNANWHTIGIEAVNNGVGQPWPAVQLDAYKRGCVAIARRVGFGANMVVGHKEYSSEGKIDPAGINMVAFRNDIQSLLSGTGDDMAQVPQDQWDRVFQELTKRFPSRSKYRSSDGLVDTMAGMVLNNDAMSHEALIERNALLGNKDAIALVKREADKGDAWAKLVYDKSPK